MISEIFMIILLIFLSFKVQAQNSMDSLATANKMTNKSIDIEEIINRKESDKKQQALLIEFKEQYQNDELISVVEFQNYYELTVNHPNEKGFSGGTECYKLDKETGETEMIWHEHPMKLQESEEN